MTGAAVRWPPPIHARVRDRRGVVYEVVAHHQGPDLGDFVILKHCFPGGWQRTPVTLSIWARDGYEQIA